MEREGEREKGDGIEGGEMRSKENEKRRKEKG